MLKTDDAHEIDDELYDQQITENKSASADPRDPSKRDVPDEKILNGGQDVITNTDDEIIAGVDVRDLDATSPDEPSEEERNARLNNTRDALNDDSYILPEEPPGDIPED